MFTQSDRHGEGLGAAAGSFVLRTLGPTVVLTQCWIECARRRFRPSRCGVTEPYPERAHEEDSRSRWNGDNGVSCTRGCTATLD